MSPSDKKEQRRPSYSKLTMLEIARQTKSREHKAKGTDALEAEKSTSPSEEIIMESKKSTLPSGAMFI